MRNEWLPDTINSLRMNASLAWCCHHIIISVFPAPAIATHLVLLIAVPQPAKPPAAE